MHQMRIASLFFVAFLALLTVGPVAAREVVSSHIRVTRDARGRPLALQTAISHFALPTGQGVDLVAAVHLADGSYYRSLDRRFKHYDAVLYELILDVPRGRHTGGVVISRDAGEASTLSQFQLILCRLLGLRFQLYSINYAAANFHHADLTAAEFYAAMSKNGESTADLLLRVLRMALDDSTGVDEAELAQVDLLALLYRDPTAEERRILRRVVAQSFPRVESLTAGIQGTTLIAGRNARAMQVVGQQLREKRRSLAVFYGAGHMADLEKRLLRLRGARLVRREWLTAWSL